MYKAVSLADKYWLFLDRFVALTAMTAA